MLQDKNSALSKYLSRLDVWGMAFGVMVGWGIFVMPGTTFLPVAGPLGTLIAMLAGMAIMLVIGYNFSASPAVCTPTPRKPSAATTPFSVPGSCAFLT